MGRDQSGPGVPSRPRDETDAGAGGEVFLSEVGWREFAHHLLFHFPHTVDHPLRAGIRAIPLAQQNESGFEPGSGDRTGFPIVDAGMRQLWATGWMHNRVRMVAASFLVKHLLQPWQAGAAWFYRTPWSMPIWPAIRSGGNGRPDAAPTRPRFSGFSTRCFRGRNLTPTVLYVRRWVPELERMDSAGSISPGWPRTGAPRCEPDLGRRLSSSRGGSSPRARRLALAAYCRPMRTKDPEIRHLPKLTLFERTSF